MCRPCHRPPLPVDRIPDPRDGWSEDSSPTSLPRTQSQPPVVPESNNTSRSTDPGPVVRLDHLRTWTGDSTFRAVWDNRTLYGGSFRITRRALGTLGSPEKSRVCEQYVADTYSLARVRSRTPHLRVLANGPVARVLPDPLIEVQSK